MTEFSAGQRVQPNPDSPYHRWQGCEAGTVWQVIHAEDRFSLDRYIVDLDNGLTTRFYADELVAAEDKAVPT